MSYRYLYSMDTSRILWLLLGQQAIKAENNTAKNYFKNNGCYFFSHFMLFFFFCPGAWGMQLPSTCCLQALLLCLHSLPAVGAHALQMLRLSSVRVLYQAGRDWCVRFVTQDFWAGALECQSLDSHKRRAQWAYKTPVLQPQINNISFEHLWAIFYWRLLKATRNSREKVQSQGQVSRCHGG